MKKYIFSMGLMFGLLLALAQPFSPAQAHFMTSAEEHEIGAAAAERTEEKYDVAWDDDIVEIQKRLIECNSTQLNWNDGRHTRWLAPMKLYHSDHPNAFMLPVGIRIWLIRW